MRETIDVSGRAQAIHCKYTGSIVNGKNTPQNRNIGKTSRYCGYEISSIVLDFAATNKPSAANSVAPAKQSGIAARAPERLKSPIRIPIPITTEAENVAFEASHMISAQSTSESVIGVTAIA